jgi:hypothetical protein
MNATKQDEAITDETIIGKANEEYVEANAKDPSEKVGIHTGIHKETIINSSENTLVM